MERLPIPSSKETAPGDQKERELTLEEQISLANALSEAVNERNIFIQGQGGFDTFAEAGQHMEGMKGDYNKLEEAVARARKEFDEKVSDKNELIKQLKNVGNDKLADLIEKMFAVKDDEGNVFSRLIKRIKK